MNIDSNKNITIFEFNNLYMIDNITKQYVANIYINYMLYL